MDQTKFLSIFHDRPDLLLEFRNKYKAIFEVHDRLVYSEYILNLQVDKDRATKLFDALEQERVSNLDSFKARLRDLTTVFKFAIDAVLLTQFGAVPEQTKLFARTATWTQDVFQFEPAPEQNDDDFEYGEDQARTESQLRDNGARRSESSDSFCSLIDLPCAQMAHIIPIGVAGGAPTKFWFWLALSILLPTKIYREIWSLCGGVSRCNKLCNVITLCYQLHRFYDTLQICFRLIEVDPDGDRFTLELEVPLQPLDFYSLSDH